MKTTIRLNIAASVKTPRYGKHDNLLVVIIVGEIVVKALSLRLNDRCQVRA